VNTAVRIIEEFGAIEAEAAHWKLLSEEANSPMHQYAWVKACSNAFTGIRKLHLVVIGMGEPGALGPLVFRGRTITRIECLGVDELYEPTDFPHSDPAALMCLANTLVEFGHPLVLRRILADSPVVSALRKAFQSRGLLFERPAAGYPWINLDSSWAEPEKKVSAKRSASLRRALCRAEKLGPIEYEIVSPKPHQLRGLLTQSLQIEAASWKGRNGSALLTDGNRRLFFEQYAAIASERGVLRLCFMKIRGKGVATQIAVESGGAFWLLKVGYDERFSRCSPGNLLMMETLRYAARRGLCTYELLGSTEPWTEIWTDQVRPCVSVWGYPNNLRGMTALTWDALRFGWERLNRPLNR
jgi:CelD/BcsL family acetyltransferase involved in cellulose biosynthesis